MSDQGGLFFSCKKHNIAGGVEPLGMVTDLTNIITLELVCDQVCFYHQHNTGGGVELMSGPGPGLSG